MTKRLKPMLVKEFLQMLRDPRMRLVVFGMPVMQMLIMAFALTTDVNRIRTALYDGDRSVASRALADAFGAGGYFRIVAAPETETGLRRILDAGKARAVVAIPAGFSRDLSAGRPAPVQVICDGTDSNTTAIVLGYAEAIVAGFNAGQGAGGGPVTVAVRAWYNANQESPLYYVPALIAVMLLVFSIMLTSIGIVREKEIGTIEQVMVTPIANIEFILGKTIPYLITGYLTMTAMLAAAVAIFGVRIHGSLLQLYVLTGIYLVGNLGLALWISAGARTQQQALLTAFLLIMPCVMLSGFMFPIHNMPLMVQAATWLNPMRWYLTILRGVVTKGVGLATLWPAVAAQSALAVGFVLLASRRFRKTLR
jgi:ABC-2 type transport system permease protein